MTTPVAVSNPVARLVAKDWHFNRGPIAAYVTVGLGSIALLGQPHEAAFYAGTVLLLTVLIAIGIHLTMSTVVRERQDHTLAFVLSLPVSPHQVTAAKLIANLAIFGTAWLMLVVATLAVIAARAPIPDGLIPYALVVLVQILAGYCLMLAVAIVSESMNWTIGAIVTGNLLLQATLYGTARLPAVAALLKTDTIAWPAPVPAILFGQLAAISCALALTFYLQARKRSFL